MAILKLDKLTILTGAVYPVITDDDVDTQWVTWFFALKIAKDNRAEWIKVARPSKQPHLVDFSRSTKWTQKSLVEAKTTRWVEKDSKEFVFLKTGLVTTRLASVSDEAKEGYFTVYVDDECVGYISYKADKFLQDYDDVYSLDGTYVEAGSSLFFTDKVQTCVLYDKTFLPKQQQVEINIVDELYARLDEMKFVVSGPTQDGEAELLLGEPLISELGYIVPLVRKASTWMDTLEINNGNYHFKVNLGEKRESSKKATES